MPTLATIKRVLMEDMSVKVKPKNTMRLIRQYRKNEDENFHSENAVLMAKHFGTKEDHARAKAIHAAHMERGARSNDPSDNEHMTRMHGLFIKHLWPHDPSNPSRFK